MANSKKKAPEARGLDGNPGGLTQEDIRSLEAVRKGGEPPDPQRARVQFSLSEPMLRGLVLAGLDEKEIDLCQEWAALRPAAGISDECRSAKSVLDHMPLLDDEGKMDKTRLWQQLELGKRLTFLWECRHFLDAHQKPRTVFGGAIQKTIRYWFAEAEVNWPTPDDLYEAVAHAEDNPSQKKKRPQPAKAVTLSAIWRAALDLEMVWHGRSYRSQLNPEDVYRGLSPMWQSTVEVDCWCADDETLLALLKRKPHGNGCDFCGVYSVDGYGWGWGGAGTSCPRCGWRIWEDREKTTKALAAQVVKHPASQGTQVAFHFD